MKRLGYFDTVKGIGILLVVLGHATFVNERILTFICAFHMPLFFIVSGMLIAYKDEISSSYKDVFHRKLKSIIIPYLWFSLSYFIIDIGNLCVVHNIDLRTFIVDTIDSATFYGMSVLWFLPALFLSSAGFLYLKKKFDDKAVAPLLIVIAIVAYVIKLQFEKLYAVNAGSLLVTSLINVIYIFLRAAIAQSFVGYGYYAKKLFDGYGDNGSKIKEMLSSRTGALISGVIFLALNIALAIPNGCADLRNILLNNVPVYFVAAFAGSLGIIQVLKAIPPVRIITYFGKNSLIVMACHINYYILYAGIKLAWLVDSYNKHAKLHFFSHIYKYLCVFAEKF